MTNKTTTYFYHPDRDGFGALWAVWHSQRAAGIQGVSKVHRYVPADYGMRINDYLRHLEESDRAIFLDFCPGTGCLARLIFEHHKDITVIDHHETGALTLWAMLHEMNPGGAASFDPDVPSDPPAKFHESAMNLVDGARRGSLTAIYDENHAASVLTWLHYNPGETVPHLLRYIEDRDLWKWELPASRPISYFIQQYDRTLQAWDELSAMLTISEGHDKATMIGTGIERHVERILELVCGDDRDGPAFLQFDGLQAAHVCSSVYQSEIGHHLIERWRARLAVVWCFLPSGALLVSLRGDGSINCAELADSFGGGGHHNAAGCQLWPDSWQLHAGRCDLLRIILNVDPTETLPVEGTDEF